MIKSVSGRLWPETRILGKYLEFDKLEICLIKILQFGNIWLLELGAPESEHS